jgi:hypothetical protein
VVPQAPAQITPILLKRTGMAETIEGRRLSG